MAAESNTGYHREETLASALSRHAISFHSGAINSSSEMIPMGNYFGVTNATGGMLFSGNSNIINNSNLGTIHSGNSSSSLLLDSVPELNDDTGLAVEWSLEEQHKLEDGLVRFGDEPSIMRYIKIAATLPEKTVRDVALRCRWMTRKRRKSEEQNAGRKVNNRKDKLVESSSISNVTSAPSLNMTAYSHMMHCLDQHDPIPCEVSTAKHLLEQNIEVINQIRANLSTFKLQENFDLFFRMRNNITAVLNDMNCMPVMNHMPELNVSINEELANSILSNAVTSQTMMFGSSSGTHLKQEPRC